MSPTFLRTSYQALGTSFSGVVLEDDEKQRLAGARTRTDDVDPWRFLQLLFQSLGHLLLDLARRRARPQGAQ